MFKHGINKAWNIYPKITFIEEGEILFAKCNMTDKIVIGLIKPHNLYV